MLKVANANLTHTHFDDDVQFYEGLHISHVQLWLETSHLGKIMPLNHTLTNGMNANAKVGLICIIFNVMFFGINANANHLFIS